MTLTEDVCRVSCVAYRAWLQTFYYYFTKESFLDDSIECYIYAKYTVYSSGYNYNDINNTSSIINITINKFTNDS